MSTLEKCRRCGATYPVIQAGQCGGCGYNQTFSPSEAIPANDDRPVVASKPDSRTGRMSNKAYNRAVVERAYETPPSGNAKKLHDAMARAVGFDEDHSVTGRGRNESIKRSHRAEGRNWVD